MIIRLIPKIHREKNEISEGVRQILSAFLPVVADTESCRYMQTNFLEIFLEVRICRPIFALSKRNND